MLLRYINTTGTGPITLTADALIDHKIERINLQVWKPTILAEKNIGEIFNGNVTTQRIDGVAKYNLTSVDKETSEDEIELFLAVENGEDIDTQSTICEVVESELPPDLVFTDPVIHDIDPYAECEDPFEDELFAKEEMPTEQELEPQPEPVQVKSVKKEKVTEPKSEPKQTQPPEPEKTVNSMEKKAKVSEKEEKGSNSMEKNTKKPVIDEKESVLSRVFDIKFGLPIVRTELMECGKTYTHETIINDAVIMAEIAAFNPEVVPAAIAGRTQYNCTLEAYGTKYVLQRFSYEEDGKTYVQERLVAEAL